MEHTCIVIDIRHLIEQNKIKRYIREQILDLGVDHHIAEDCTVNFVAGKPNYTGYLVDIESGTLIKLDPEYSVVKALVNL
tara:strand:- start:181 stop:420 length:240 start_codon:yes stop_codon:yes gene_type:complete